MSGIDIILLVLLVYGAYAGYTKGLLMEVVNTGSLILGIFIGIKFWRLGAEYIKVNFENSPHILPFIGFLLIFIVVLIGVRLIGKIFKMGLDKTLFGSIDKILGALLGVVKWVFGIAAFLWILLKYPIFDIDNLLTQSVICNKVVYCTTKVLMFF